MQVRPHKVVESKKTGVDAIKLTEDPYSGIIFHYGKVGFDEDEEEGKLRISFDYEILDDAGIEYDQDRFEQYLGDFLQELIHFGLKENNLVYTGGVDENRRKDSKQSDL